MIKKWFKKVLGIKEVNISQEQLDKLLENARFTATLSAAKSLRVSFGFSEKRFTRFIEDLNENSKDLVEVKNWDRIIEKETGVSFSKSLNPK